MSRLEYNVLGNWISAELTKTVYSPPSRSFTIGDIAKSLGKSKSSIRTCLIKFNCVQSEGTRGDKIFFRERPTIKLCSPCKILPYCDIAKKELKL